MANQAPTTKEKATRPEFVEAIIRIALVHGSGKAKDVLLCFGFSKAAEEMTQSRCDECMADLRAMVPECFPELPEQRPVTATELRERSAYAELRRVLDQAFDDQTQGKAKSRHNKTGLLPFEQQRIMTISETIRSPHGLTYQITKKMLEALEMDEVEKTIHELQGVVVYVGALILYVERQELRRRAPLAQPTTAEE